MNRKAQSQIITTVLIILLVLAAIVIVWQVVNRTVVGAGSEVEKQGNCLGISMGIKNLNESSDKNFTIKRLGGGTITPEPTLKIVGNTSACSWTPSNPDWTQDQFSAKCDFTAAQTGTIEVALKLDDGTFCPITGSVDI